MTKTDRQVQAWCRAEVAKADEREVVRIPDLVDSALAHFSKDPAFVEAFLHEHMKPMLYSVIQRELARTRALDRIEMSAAKQEIVKNKWAEWMEQVQGGHKRLVEMDRRDLAFAINERMKRIQTEYSICRAFRRLANGLRPGERVGDRFSPREIQEIFEDEARGTNSAA